MYALTDDAEDEDKDAFYHQLQATLQNIKRWDIKSEGLTDVAEDTVKRNDIKKLYDITINKYYNTT